MRRPCRWQVRNNLLMYIVSSDELVERNANSTLRKNMRASSPKRDKTGPKVATKNFVYSVADEKKHNSSLLWVDSRVVKGDRL